jgi:hypothetical protein
MRRAITAARRTLATENARARSNASRALAPNVLFFLGVHAAMKRLALLAVFGIGSHLVTVTAAPAQNRQDDASILLSVFAHEPWITGERFMFDRRVIRNETEHHSESMWGGESEAALAVSLGAALPIQVARYSEVKRCAPGRSRCELVGATRFVGVSRPRIQGDTATVRLFVEWATPDSRQGTNWADLLFTVVRREGGWQVVRRQILAET